MNRLHLIAGLSAAALAGLLWLAPSPTASTTAAKPAAEPAPPREFAISHVRLFDGEKTWPDATVHVKDGLIAAVGAAVDVPKGVHVIDGRGATLLPGLIDAHVHSWGEARRQALRFGVATELDMFSDHKAIAAARTQRAALTPSTEADLWSAGTLVTVKNGHGTQFGMAIPTLDDGVDADAFVQARIAEGSDYIKLVFDDGHAYGDAIDLPTLSGERVAQVIAAAHAHDRRAVVHVASADAARTAADADADGLVHVFSDRVADDALVDAMRANGMFVVPTLSVMASLSGDPGAAALADDARLQPYVDGAQRDSLRTSFPSQWQQSEHLQHALENVRRLHAAGVPILAGTDAGNPGTAHGASLHGELELLVRAGLTPSAALHAATAAPARAFGIADRGRIAAGLRADLVLVDGDPTADITATRAIRTVWKNGVAVDRAVAKTAAAGAPSPAIAPMLVSDFDGDDVLKGAIGAGWQQTTDAMMGGTSQATLARAAQGAAGSRGALSISGEIAPGVAYPWAGAMLFPHDTPMQPVDATAVRELVFNVRGDGRTYAAMLFSGSEMQRMPAMQMFSAGPEWREVRLSLDAFAGAEPARLRAIAFTAGMPAGRFELQIDDVQLR